MMKIFRAQAYSMRQGSSRLVGMNDEIPKDQSLSGQSLPCKK